MDDKAGRQQHYKGASEDHRRAKLKGWTNRNKIGVMCLNLMSIKYISWSQNYYEKCDVISEREANEILGCFKQVIPRRGRVVSVSLYEVGFIWNAMYIAGHPRSGKVNSSKKRRKNRLNRIIERIENTFYEMKLKELGLFSQKQSERGHDGGKYQRGGRAI